MHEKCSQRFEPNMAYNVVVTPKVRKCFKEAVAYTVNVLCAPQSATTLSDSFSLALLALENNPTFCPRDYYASNLFQRPIYKKRIGSYFLYSFVDGDTVIAFSFLHKRQNKCTHLKADYDEA